ncbi:unnamed protein product [Sphagnum jensenii]|uniref:Uncharacterized protein n=1 Tax=Sphagnum jensenii TaxID=128206 RepID=A0ABP1A5Y9_9BRYO
MPKPRGTFLLPIAAQKKNLEMDPLLTYYYQTLLAVSISDFTDKIVICYYLMMITERQREYKLETLPNESSKSDPAPCKL